MRYLYFQEAASEDVLKGMMAGLAGGLAATWIMTQFQNLTSSLSQDGELNGGEQDQQESQQRQQDQARQQDEPPEPATVKAAEAVSQRLLHHELTAEQKEPAAQAIHYAMGGGTGVIYGALAEAVPQIRMGHGAAYGAAVWLMADEVAVPALGLSDPPTQHPPSTHLYSLGSHLVYGLVLETVRNGVRKLFD